MNKCLSCGEVYEGDLMSCSTCQCSPVIVNGFTSFTFNDKELCKGFNPETFLSLSKVENNNFWFIARAKLIVFFLRKYTITANSFMEVGCGNGHVLNAIEHASIFETIYGSELYTEGLVFAQQRVKTATFIQMNAKNMPFVQEFSAIGAFDVLEHIDDDVKVISEIHQSLKANGLFILTVPQHKWLWSNADDRACHVRRYCEKSIHQKLKSAGFDIVYSTSFVSLLLPIMYISRLIQKDDKASHNISNELDLPTIINLIFSGVMSIERFMIKCGLCFPLGGSRLVIARKHKSNQDNKDN